MKTGPALSADDLAAATWPLRRQPYQRQLFDDVVSTPESLGSDFSRLLARAVVW